MALHRSFRAEDTIDFRTYEQRRLFPGANYYPDLEALGVREELFALSVNTNLGLVFSSAETNSYSPHTINFLGINRQVEWPSWNVSLWRFDGDQGRRTYFENGDGFLQPHISSLPDDTAVISSFQRATRGDNGTIYFFGGTLQATPYLLGYGNAEYEENGEDVVRRTLQLNPLDAGAAIVAEDFLDPAGNTAIAIQDLAVSTYSDRMFVRWSTNNVGQVAIYSISAREYLGSIWTPNQTTGIVTTDDGFVYVYDQADWICVYDFDGSFYGAMKNTRRQEFVGGVTYGWDPYYKRLLFVQGTATLPGESTLRIRALSPQPDAGLVTQPVPREVPRVNRPSYFFSRVCGDGGEPLATRRADVTGTTEMTLLSDRDGDIIVPVTPIASPVSVAIEVWAEYSEEDV